ncbi:MAG: glycosyltransferase, partial [Gammaproteobacteria bacterium]|nr:glycosyltransferase [Gammaproteobacteria bacterium]
DYDQLPGYVGAFDVGLIPFQVNEITRATSPIKLYEYLAAGVPVVSAPLPEVEDFEGVTAASSPEEFAGAIHRALESSRDPALVGRLREQAREHEWETRAELILDCLEEVEMEGTHAREGKAPGRRRGEVPWWLRRAFHIWRLSGIRGLLAAVVNKLSYLTRSRFSLRIKIPRAYRETYIPENFSQVTLYYEGESPFPGYRPGEPLSHPEVEKALPVSLIATAFNEEDSVEQWMDAILEGSVLPTEIVIVDAGSTDATVARLEAYQDRCPVPLRIVEQSRVNIARGRNLAVQAAEYPIIAVTDFGCRPHRDWLEKLTSPFYLNPETEVVGGWSRAVNQRGIRVEYPGWLTLDDVDPGRFIPSSRSIGFTRQAWEKAGGYPEWLTLTGEDTYFAWELKRFCPHWAFVPSAVVDWSGSNTWLGFLKKAYAWSVGNGELGYNNWLYLQAAKRLVLFVITLMLAGMTFIRGGVWLTVGGLLLAALLVIFALDGVPPWRLPGEMGLLATQVLGFLRGASRKREVDRRRLAGVRGVFLILA